MPEHERLLSRASLAPFTAPSPQTVPAMIFGAAVERSEHQQERQRRRRLAGLLKKHGLDEQTGPIGWRI